jgi:predicted lipid carrier protein YhbT
MIGRREPNQESPPVVNRADVDDQLRSVVAAIEGAVRQPVDSSYHVHQLDGARLEAMVYLEPAGARIVWVHGKGTCAITGEGAAILAVLRGEGDPDTLETEGRLVLYGDRELIRAAATVFKAESA